MKKEIAIVYMVAGLSSRFGGKVKSFAKVGPLGETLIEYSLNQAISAGFNKIIFIVGNQTKDLFHEKFGNEYQGVKIAYTKQEFDINKRDKPWGTTDALCTIKNIITCPFVVCNGDDIYGKKDYETLYNHLIKNENECSTLGYDLISTLTNNGTVNRGIINIDSFGFVKEIKEMINLSKEKLNELKLNEKSLCSMNIFALYPNNVLELNNKLNSFKINNQNNRKIECYLQIEISQLISENKIKMKLYPAKEKWLGVTNPGDEEIVRKQLE